MLAVLSQAPNFTSSGPTPIQKAFALLLFAIALAIILAVLVRAGYRALDEEQREVKAGIKAAVSRTTPETLTLDAPTVRREGVTTGQRQDLEAFLAGLDPRTPTVGHAEHHSTRDVLEDFRDAWRDVFRGRLSHAPRATIRGLRWAVLVSILGATAVHAGVLARWLQSAGGPGGFSMAKAAQNAIDYTLTAVDTGAALLSANPLFEILWSVGLTAVLIGGEWLYARWYVVAGVLLAAAAVAYLLDDSVPDSVHDYRLFSRWHLAVGAATATIGIWLVGVAPTMLGQAAGHPDRGAAAGLLLAVIGVLGVLTAGIGWAAWTTYWAARTQTGQVDRRILAAIVTDRVVDAGAVVAAALTPVYLIVIVADGALGTLLAGLLAAPWYIHLALAVGVLVAAAGVSWALRDHWADLRGSLEDILGRQHIRVALFARAFPVLGAAIGAVLTVSFTGSLPAAAVGGLLAGIVLHRGYRWAGRIRHRAYVYEAPPNEPKRILVQGRYLDIDGGQYHIRVNGTRSQLHPNRDEMISDLERVIENVATEGEAVPTESGWHAQFAREVGITDIEESRQKIRRKVEMVIDYEGRQADGRVAIEDTHDELDEGFPEEYWRPEWNKRVGDDIRVFGGYWQLWRDDKASSDPVRDLGSSPIEVLKT